MSTRANEKRSVEVVGFGMIVPATLVIVDHLAEPNFGSEWRQVTEYISDDAAIVAMELPGWGVRTGFIGTSLGRDAAGRRTIRALDEAGVQRAVRTTSKFPTPYELVISDVEGNRTYYWRKDDEVLRTLDAADLSMVRDAKLLYVDWYDRDYILRAMDEAVRHGVSVFLNVEHGHEEAHIVDEYLPRASICQAVTDATQRGGEARDTLDVLRGAGVGTAIVTLARGGCLVSSGGETLRAYAPTVDVVDACGAGATFSSGFILGRVRGWGLEDSVRFAVAAASLKCTVVGPRAFDFDEVRHLARELRVERV